MLANQSQTLDVASNNKVCDAVGCCEKFTEKIAVKVGQEKKITLNLCKDCVEKFEDK
jgi:hypothetical protein